MALGSIKVFDVILGGVVLYVLKQLFNKRKLHLPPGPKRKPIIGNLLDLPQGDELDWIHWLKHKDLYGPFSSMTVFGQHIVVLNDMRLAVDLLDKKSTVFSNRPEMVFCGKLCGWDRSLVIMQNGPRHKAIRKILHRFMGSGDSVAGHHLVLDVESRRCLLRTLKNPSRFAEHLRTMTGAIILKLSHGYAIEPEGSDPFVKLGDDALSGFSLAAQSGTWVVDVLPFLQYLPDWFPGAGFKRVARKVKEDLDEMADKPFAFVKKQLKSGHYYPSLTSTLLEDGIDNEDIKSCGIAIYGGGADTSVSANCSFYLAMTLYPDIQQRAQEEIDRVIGTDRLPTFSDRKNLPYINALAKETLRRYPIVPLVPHVPTEDSVVNGYMIPKGSIMLANIWQFNHDPARYHDPTKFNPERFLGESPEPDPYDSTFGFGRRICPGKELADATLFICIAQSLAAFTIKKAKDANDQDIIPKEEYTNGAISRPKDFVCSIKPRTEKVVALIKAVEDEYPFEPGHSAELVGLDWKTT